MNYDALLKLIEELAQAEHQPELDKHARHEELQLSAAHQVVPVAHEANRPAASEQKANIQRPRAPDSITRMAESIFAKADLLERQLKRLRETMEADKRMEQEARAARQQERPQIPSREAAIIASWKRKGKKTIAKTRDEIER